MMAYLAMMAVRLLELRDVLKPTGSLYLHCDPNASHYLKIILDALFGPSGFRTEISWRRQSAHNDAKQGRKQYGNVRDTILSTPSPTNGNGTLNISLMIRGTFGTSINTENQEQAARIG